MDHGTTQGSAPVESPSNLKQVRSFTAPVAERPSRARDFELDPSLSLPRPYEYPREAAFVYPRSPENVSWISRGYSRSPRSETRNAELDRLSNCSQDAHPQQQPTRFLHAMEWARPDPELIGAKWLELLADSSLNQLKQTAFQGNITILRSVYWRIFLGQLPPPPNPNPSHPALTSWTFRLEKSRSEWVDLRQQYLRAPDGLWLEDSIESSEQNLNLKLNQRPISTSILPIDSQPTDLGVNNPLSQHQDNPWNVWLRDLELRKTIKQDVIRTFPELEYFRQGRTQAMLTNILHVYCKLHQDIGYRQGMHEILGVLLETLDLDSLDRPRRETRGQIHQVLSRDHLEHDAFSLFSLLMKPMKNWYDPNLSIPLGDVANSQTTPLTSVGFIPSQLATTPPAPTTCPDDLLVHPIVEKCASIFHVYLKHADPELWAHLDTLEIEPQLWGIRWLRLLFTREFTYQESLLLWDGIFAQEGDSLRLADFVCIAMLLRIREGLLDSDYSGALQLILRFPRPADEDSRIALLLYQAILLYQFPTPDTVSLIIRQNLDLQLFTAQLSSTTQESDSWFSNRRKLAAPSTMTTPRELLNRNQHPTPLHSASHPPSNSKANPSNQQSPIISKQTQSLSKSKSFLGALADLRKSYSSTTPLDNRLVSESPPPTATQPQSPLNLMNSFSPILPKQNPNPCLQSQDTQCLANQAVGQALGLCVDALEQNLLRGSGQPIDSSQGLALGALKHIRDIMLSGFSSGFDSNVMSPLIEYQSATTPSTHPVFDLSASSSSLHTSDFSSPTPGPCGPSRSATTDSPELSFNQSNSEGSPASVHLSGGPKNGATSFGPEGEAGGPEKRRPLVQPLSPSIFGTKLWIDAAPVSSSGPSHSLLPFSRSAKAPVSHLPSLPLLPPAHSPQHQQLEDHFESLMLVESHHRHLSLN